jgi:hypothetical protein
MVQQHYKFNRVEFNEDGNSTRVDECFLDLIRKWEDDFHDRYSPFFANYLFANSSTMALTNNCLVTEPNEEVGMELINEEIDLDTNLKIEHYSKRSTIYAIGSNHDLDEPLFLIRDESIHDGMVILKYVPEHDEDDLGPDIPIEGEKIKVSLTKR